MSSLFRPSSQKIRKQYQYILPGSSIRTNSATGYVGVYLNGKGYRAQIGNNGEQIYIGSSYDTAEQAANAFDAAAMALGRSPSTWNFPEKVPPVTAAASSSSTSSEDLYTEMSDQDQMDLLMAIMLTGNTAEQNAIVQESLDRSWYSKEQEE